MTKNLSEKICKICGIKPITYHDYELNEYEAYPDFGEPENFVKLLEIISRKATVLFSHNGVYFGCSIHYGFDEIFEAVKGSLAKNFLNTLTLLPCRNTYYPKLLELEEIKQAIRKAEWKYD